MNRISRVTPYLLTALVLALVLALAGCGGSTGGSTGDSTGGSSTPETPSIDVQACNEELGPFVDKVAEINSRLDVGLNVGEMSDRLGDAKVEYDNLDIDELQEITGCLAVGTTAEKAYNNYVKSLQAWQDCIDEGTCEDGSTPKMQRLWAKAASQVDSVKGKLDE